MQDAHPEEAPLAGEEFFWRDRCAHKWVFDRTQRQLVCANCGIRHDAFVESEKQTKQPDLV